MATFGNLETEVEPLASLMREHIEVHELVTSTQEAIEEALGRAEGSSLADAALDALRDLDAYLAEDLAIHIAKEEQVLFPALQGLKTDIDQVVDEMVEQHDEVRLRQSILQRTLAALDHTHHEIDAETAALAAGVRAMDAECVTPDGLAALLDAVRRLNWILQGHFGDEEDDLFVPALALLSGEAFASLAEQCRVLEAAALG